MTPPRPGAAIVLAAGRSARMGRPKAALAYQGGTFLSVILDRLRAAGFPAPIVVLPRGGVSLAPSPAIVVENEAQERGQAWSLALGLGAVSPAAPWALVTLVDHPAVRAETYARVAEEAGRAGGAVVVAAHGGRRGHPVAWPRALFGELGARWAEEGGARAVAARLGALVREVAVDDPGVVQDVDTPEDYRELQSS